VSPVNRCVDTKNHATAKAFACVVRAEDRMLQSGGATVDPTPCLSKLARAYATAEAKGGCPTMDDESAVAQRIVDTENDVLSALQADQATTPAAKKCIAVENGAAGNLAKCVAKVLGKALHGQTHCCENNACPGQFVSEFLRGHGCQAINLDAVEMLAMPLGANLAGGELGGVDLARTTVYGLNMAGGDLSNANLLYSTLNGANFTGTDLAGVYLFDAGLSGANLTNADVTGATLEAVHWRATICPDGTESDTNGSDPESCCANLNGQVPSSCSAFP
jgi:hypothetical protein